MEGRGDPPSALPPSPMGTANTPITPLSSFLPSFSHLLTPLSPSPHSSFLIASLLFPHLLTPLSSSANSSFHTQRDQRNTERSDWAQCALLCRNNTIVVLVMKRKVLALWYTMLYARLWYAVHSISITACTSLKILSSIKHTAGFRVQNYSISTLVYNRVWH